MKTLLLLALCLGLPITAAHAQCACCTLKPLSLTTEKPSSYPLKGVIVNILTERSALLVKHEEIPDYMKAMTMMFKVDAETLKSVKKGQTITGNLIKKADGFWLEDVKVSKDS